jgi:dUTP pyrophosphatase
LKPQVKITLDPGATMPQYAHDTDSGADLFSIYCHTMAADETYAFPTGVHIELPAGYEAQVRSKSGLATRGLHVMNSPGTVDNGYRGEIFVILHNASGETRFIDAKQKIAQLVVAPYVQATFVDADTLTTTERGEGGLGSTGLEAKPIPLPTPGPPVNVPNNPLFITGHYPEDGRRIERDREEGWEQQ